MSRTNYLQLRFSDSELASYQALANQANLSLAVWVRDRLNGIVRTRKERCADCNQIEDEHDLGGSGHRFRLSHHIGSMNYQDTEEASRLLSRQPRHNFHSIVNRELSLSELSCPVHGCSLDSSHRGPCLPKPGDPETKEVYIQNLMILSRDDPEGFRKKIRELIKNT
jgi:hypothetical protein